MSTLIDISVHLDEEMPVWPGSVGFRRHDTMRLDEGDPANVSRIETDVHCGTHVEGPLHFLADGEALERLPLDTFVGRAIVADLSDVDDVTAHSLERLAIPERAERLLIRTRNSQLWSSPDRRFREEYVALTLDAARWIADRGMLLVGVDYLSIQRFHDGPETHRVLMRAGVAVLEGLDLSGVSPGAYTLMCLPLKIPGTEASPVRAVLSKAETGDDAS